MVAVTVTSPVRGSPGLDATESVTALAEILPVPVIQFTLDVVTTVGGVGVQSTVMLRLPLDAGRLIVGIYYLMFILLIIGVPFTVIVALALAAVRCPVIAGTLAVMVTLPGDTGVTTPPDTVAIVVSELPQDIVAVEFVVAVRVILFPIVTAVAEGDIDTVDVIGTTDTVQLAVSLPAVADITVVPLERADTTPPDTVATLVLVLVHVTVGSVAFPGVTVAVRVSPCP